MNYEILVSDILYKQDKTKISIKVIILHSVAISNFSVSGFVHTI